MAASGPTSTDANAPPAPAAGPFRALLLWACLAFGFSPVLGDLALHVESASWSWYVVVFPLLFALALRRDRGPHPTHAWGMALLVLGLAIELAAAFAGTIRYGRLGLLLGAFGLSRRFGLASDRSLLLLALCIPAPGSLVKIGAPEIPRALLALGHGILSALGVDLPMDIPVMGNIERDAPTRFGLDQFDTGLALVPLLAGLSWYDSAARGRAIGPTVLRAGLWILAAIPIQIANVVLALAIASSGDATLARHALTHAGWVTTAVLGILAIEWRLRRSDT